MGLFAFRRLRERQQEASAITAGAFPIAEAQSAPEAAVEAAEVPTMKRVQARGRRQARSQEAG